MADESLTTETKLGTESAYPITPPLDDGGQVPAGYPYAEGGLTKRELLAALAMQGVIASNELHPDDIAEFAVNQADRLLKELAK